MNTPDRGRNRLRVLRLAGSVVLSSLIAAPSWAQDVKTIVTTVCIACHTEDGNSAVPMFPKIAGLQEAYIAKQLQDFMSGRRKSDIMGPIVAQLKPEDVLPLATYFSQQKMKAGDADDKTLVGIGKVIFHDGNEETGVPACLGCHQAQGIGFGIYPRIGGQHIDYVKQQLKSFATGERSNDVSRFMRTTAKRLSDEEINAVAQYLVGLGDK